jgi:four helix bundle protein
MGVNRFEDLIAWQLANRLQDEVLALISTGPATRDFKFCDQIRESLRSAPANTAEGFGRYYPRDFRRCLRIAAGSLNETKNHLHEGKSRGYFSDRDHERVVRLSLRAIKANVRLAAYLATATAPDPFQKTAAELESGKSGEPGEPHEP